MNIYADIDNVCKGTIYSPQLLLGQTFEYIQSDFFSLGNDFIPPGVTINISLEKETTVDSFILVGNNYMSAIVDFIRESVIIKTISFDYKEEMDIQHFENLLIDAVQIKLIEKDYTKNIIINYIYVGHRYKAPRFIVEPEIEDEFLSKSNRSDFGYSYGLYGPVLRNYQLSFVRITQLEYEQLESYYKKVRNNVPHIVDIYPEAHEVITPLFCTVDNSVNRVKRPENNFYWNFELAFKEAK